MTFEEFSMAEAGDIIVSQKKGGGHWIVSENRGKGPKDVHCLLIKGDTHRVPKAVFMKPSKDGKVFKIGRHGKIRPFRDLEGPRVKIHKISTRRRPLPPSIFTLTGA